MLLDDQMHTKRFLPSRLRTTTAQLYLQPGKNPMQAFWDWYRAAGGPTSEKLRNVKIAWDEIRLSMAMRKKAVVENKEFYVKIGGLMDALGRLHLARKCYEKAALCHFKASKAFGAAGECGLVEKSLLKEISALKSGIERMEGPTFGGNFEAERTLEMRKSVNTLIAAMKALADAYEAHGKTGEASKARAEMASVPHEHGRVYVQRLLWAAYYILNDSDVKVEQPTIH